MTTSLENIRIRRRGQMQKIQDLHPVNTGLYGNSSIIHMAPNVGEDLHKPLVTILFYRQKKA